MRALNPQAWNNLDQAEQTALSLNFAYEKSTWEAGEIMNRSHYKYLEIKGRAEYFLKLFTEYYTLFKRLIPEYLTGDKLVISYFRLCLEKRNKPKRAISRIEELEGKRVVKSILNQKIEKQMAIWGKSEVLEEKKTFDLIKDFDRWNNFRILPKSCQEPSAFERRLKNVYKNQLKILRDLNEFSLEHLKDILRAKNKKDKVNCLYLPLLEKDGTPKIYAIKNKPKYLEILDDISLYYFDDAEKAKEYLTLIRTYISNTDRKCQDGLRFWPAFRAQIKKASNYDKIFNKAPHRRYLRVALSKVKFI